jgi:hypothetical protein
MIVSVSSMVLIIHVTFENVNNAYSAYANNAYGTILPPGHYAYIAYSAIFSIIAMTISHQNTQECPACW